MVRCGVSCSVLKVLNATLRWSLTRESNPLIRLGGASRCRYISKASKPRCVLNHTRNTHIVSRSWKESYIRNNSELWKEAHQTCEIMLVEEAGIEPTMAASKAVALPLGYSSMMRMSWHRTEPEPPASSCLLRLYRKRIGAWAKSVF